MLSMGSQALISSINGLPRTVKPTTASEEVLDVRDDGFAYSILTPRILLQDIHDVQ